MKQVEFEEYIEEFETYRDESVIVTSDKNYILKGLDNDFNELNGIKVLDTKHFAGTIVNFKGDVCLGNYQNNFNSFGSDFMKNLLNYLSDKGLHCYLDGNDLLVDGFKTASYMSTKLNNIIYTAIHIPIFIDLDIIKKVCKKQMVKVPKGLSDYGITTEEIINFIKQLYA